MADSLGDRVLDYGLDVLDTEATHLYICSQEPTTFIEASSTYALGNKNFGAGGVFGGPAAGSPNGRKVSSTEITDGAVTGSDTAVKWAVTDDGNSRLLADGSLASSQPVTSGNTFSLPSFDITIPSQ
jgi:hypothetical protein